MKAAVYITYNPYGEKPKVSIDWKGDGNAEPLDESSMLAYVQQESLQNSLKPHGEYKGLLSDLVGLVGKSFRLVFHGVPEDFDRLKQACDDFCSIKNAELELVSQCREEVSPALLLQKLERICAKPCFGIEKLDQELLSEVAKRISGQQTDEEKAKAVLDVQTFLLEQPEFGKQFPEEKQWQKELREIREKRQWFEKEELIRSVSTEQIWEWIKDWKEYALIPSVLFTSFKKNIEDFCQGISMDDLPELSIAEQKGRWVEEAKAVAILGAFQKKWTSRSKEFLRSLTEEVTCDLTKAFEGYGQIVNPCKTAQYTELVSKVSGKLFVEADMGTVQLNTVRSCEEAIFVPSYWKGMVSQERIQKYYDMDNFSEKYKALMEPYLTQKSKEFIDECVGIQNRWKQEWEIYYLSIQRGAQITDLMEKLNDFRQMIKTCTQI